MLEKSERKNEMLEKLNVTEKETRNHWTLIDNARNPWTNGEVRLVAKMAKDGRTMPGFRPSITPGTWHIR